MVVWRSGYTMMASRFIAGANPVSVLSAKADVYPECTIEGHRHHAIDTGMNVSLQFPKDVTADIMCNMLLPGWGPFELLPQRIFVDLEATCEGGKVFLKNFVAPSAWHYIAVNPTAGSKTKKRVEKAYSFKAGKGEDWWSRYVT